MKSNSNPNPPISDRRLTEINYHRKLNLRFVIIALPNFLFFTGFYYLRANYLQTWIFALLTLNAIVGLYLGGYIKDRDRLLLLQRVSGGIAFGLLAGSLLVGLWGSDFYTILPWLFIYPVTTLLFFGERVGICYAIFFCIGAGVIVYLVDFPDFSGSTVANFKTSLLLALFTTLLIGLSSERTRVRMRNNLIAARNKYKSAEEHQRKTNNELKSEIAMRVRSEQALARSEAHYRTLFEESAVSLWEEDYSKVKQYLDDLPQEVVENLEDYFSQNPGEAKKCIGLVWLTNVNRATLDLYEAESKSDLVRNIWEVLPPDLEKYITNRLVYLYRHARYEAHVRGRTLTGRKLDLLLGSVVPAGYEDTWEKVFTSVYDITERVTMEEERKLIDRQWHHTRQIQAIASLAGGIAHQFNNALAVIWGNLDLLERRVTKCERTTRYFGFLRGASEHIRRLTEQLLAYARGGKYQPMDFSLNDLVADMLKASKISRDRKYEIKLELEDEIILAGGDITQIRIVLDAVFANAAEAMGDGGQILISARNTLLEQGHPAADGTLPPGRYAIITFEDHGIGMDEETCQRIFEPFFTTKFVGRGLGMAAAFGIVRNHDGIIEVTSQPTQGTRVTIYLPSAEKRHEADLIQLTQRSACA